MALLLRKIMFIILKESGEYSDYCVRMLGYVDTEDKAKEIVARKNKELEVLFKIKELYENFFADYDIRNPFKWSKNSSFEEEEKEMEEFEKWNKEKIEAINLWIKENNLTQEKFREVQYLYGDKYTYENLKEYEDKT